MSEKQRIKNKKRKKIRLRIAQNLIFNIKNRHIFLKILNFYTKINRSWKISASETPAGFFCVTDNQGNKLHVIHKDRLPFYKTGIYPRVSGLLHDYMIDLDAISENDVFLDCGANIGEIGVGLQLAGKAVRYVAFEPGKLEHAACSLNNPMGHCERSALWYETSVLTFYEKSDSADSSLIEFGGYENVTQVPTTTIDEYCAANGIVKIKYLKIEAEGAEPEVIQGATGMLPSTHFVAIDCGYERGFDKESTLPKVCNQLIKSGFILVEIKEHRLIALFENSKFASDN